jgi:hypothetical protein
MDPKKVTQNTDIKMIMLIFKEKNKFNKPNPIVAGSEPRSVKNSQKYFAKTFTSYIA